MSGLIAKNDIFQITIGWTGALELWNQLSVYKLFSNFVRRSLSGLKIDPTLSSRVDVVEAN